MFLVFFFLSFNTGTSLRPETLRCFMAYLIDMKLVLHELFYDLPDASRTVTKDTIAEAFERCNNKCVQYEVRQYARAGDWGHEEKDERTHKVLFLPRVSCGPHYELNVTSICSI
jgi:hypothetical protein